MAHAVEALYARGTNPVVAIMAEQAIAALKSGLTDVVGDEQHTGGRDAALYGAWLAATCSGLPAWRFTTSSVMCWVGASTFPTPRRML
jgi:alcohol dehydrogenase class IV